MPDRKETDQAVELTSPLTDALEMPSLSVSLPKTNYLRIIIMDAFIAALRMITIGGWIYAFKKADENLSKSKSNSMEIVQVALHGGCVANAVFYSAIICAIKGGIIGAANGSLVVPGVGTFIGAAIGAIVGLIIGANIGAGIGAGLANCFAKVIFYCADNFEHIKHYAKVFGHGLITALRMITIGGYEALAKSGGDRAVVLTMLIFSSATTAGFALGLGTASGGIKGALIGSTLGSIIPGGGTAIGALVGTIIGCTLGAFTGNVAAGVIAMFAKCMNKIIDYCVDKYTAYTSNPHIMFKPAPSFDTDVPVSTFKPILVSV